MVVCLQEELPTKPSKPLKLVDYNDDDDDDASGAMDDDSGSSLKDGDLVDPVSSPPPTEAVEEELKLPVREKAEDDATAFFSGIAAQKSSKATKARSPQYKNMFQKISWKQGSKSESTSKPMHESSESANPDSGIENESGELSRDDGDTSALLAKRKLELEEAQAAESIVKKSKTGTPISSS